LKLLCIALFSLLTGCEGTWATPNQIDLQPQAGSHISGLATARIVSYMQGRSIAVSAGSDIDVQFQQLRNPRPYVLVVERGSCARPGSRVAHFGLYAYPEQNEGLESTGQVNIPIHHLMKDGYAIALLDERRNTIVSCGDLRTNRPF
jgi:hypothetical protein